MKDPNQQGQLANEYELMSDLKRPKQMQGFVEIFHFGREGPHICLVMELLGHSLEDCMEAAPGNKFDLKTTVLVAQQILHRLEYLHSKRIIHRDVKPENFMMGRGAKVHIVHLIDFGLSEVYFLDGVHAIQQKDTLTGTARYASINAHDRSQSRRDDLEAVGHMLVYFLKGTLPWSGLMTTVDDDDLLIRDKKKATKLHVLCEGLPSELEEYLDYCRRLSFTQRPDYARLQRLFDQMRERLEPLAPHDLQWLRGTDLKPETLVPMQPWEEVVQPDDGQRGSLLSLSIVFECCRWLKPRETTLGSNGGGSSTAEGARRSGVFVVPLTVDGLRSSVKARDQVPVGKKSNGGFE